jgi:hypothetical protein
VQFSAIRMSFGSVACVVAAKATTHARAVVMDLIKCNESWLCIVIDTLKPQPSCMGRQGRGGGRQLRSAADCAARVDGCVLSCSTSSLAHLALEKSQVEQTSDPVTRRSLRT